tara:strand:+ start:2127 stop:2252 length:126 start_codon:yes stop_codon:yes gene_type:complete
MSRRIKYKNEEFTVGNAILLITVIGLVIATMVIAGVIATSK